MVYKELLGAAFTGTVGSARWSGHNYIPLAQRQLCWVHLLRDFQKLVDAGGDGARMGRELLSLSRRLMRSWHRVRDETLPFEQLARRAQPIRTALQKLRREGALFYQGKARVLSRELLRQEVALTLHRRARNRAHKQCR